ncbi:MAG TPA: TolC family protein [Chitinophagaceae bacterium]|nr:TolC family protein [Chitinophagaceae bacterium]
MKHPLRLSNWSVLLLTLVCCSMATAQDKHEFSIKQAVDYANKNSAVVKNALINIQIQQQTNREITAMALPNVTGSIDVTYYPKVPVQSFPNFIAQATYGVLTDEGVKDGNGNPIVAPSDFGFIQAQFGTRYTSSAGVSLSQLLFDGQVFIGLQARKAAISFAEKTAEVTQEMIKANIYKIYYQVIIGRQQMTSIDANIARTEKLLSDTRELFKNGFAEKLDVSKVEVNLANLRTERVRVDNQTQLGLMGLKMLMGMPVKHELILTDTLSEAELKDSILESAFTYSDRKEYQLMELAKRLGEFNVRRYNLSRLPTVALYGTYSKNAQRNEFNFFNFNEKWFSTALVGVKVSVPIFEGFAKQARIKRAQLELQQTENNIDSLRLSIENEVERSRVNMRSALASMDYQQQNMQLALEVYEQTKKKYEQGLGSNLEITNAQTELRIAQNNYYSALYDAIIARVDFLKATGKL